MCDFKRKLFFRRFSKKLLFKTFKFSKHKKEYVAKKFSNKKLFVLESNNIGCIFYRLYNRYYKNLLHLLLVTFEKRFIAKTYTKKISHMQTFIINNFSHYFNFKTTLNLFINNH